MEVTKSQTSSGGTKKQHKISDAETLKTVERPETSGPGRRMLVMPGQQPPQLPSCPEIVIHKQALLAFI